MVVSPLRRISSCETTILVAVSLRRASYEAAAPLISTFWIGAGGLLGRRRGGGALLAGGVGGDHAENGGCGEQQAKVKGARWRWNC